MSANVFMVIIPNQRKVVAALRAQEEPDPKLGIEAKQRSLHNNYLTLPVIFLMLSIHNPLAFASEYNWVIASLVFLMGVSIRHYFNTYYAQKGVLTWTWGVTFALFALIAWISTLSPPSEAEEEQAARLSIAEQRFTKHARFDDVVEIVTGRCSMCHATEPAWEGIAVAPNGVKLETPEDVAKYARDIYLQSARSWAMPPGNITELEAADRAAIATWYQEASRAKAGG